MKTILLLLISTLAFAQSPVTLEKHSGKYFMSFDKFAGKQVTWTTYGYGKYFSKPVTEKIVLHKRIEIDEMSNLWIINGKDTVSVWIIMPLTTNQRAVVIVNGRNFDTGDQVPRSLWAYNEFIPEIEEKYLEEDN